MDITFKFPLNQKVTTPFNEQGQITVCGIDETGITYYVKTPGGGNWFKESELTA